MHRLLARIFLFICLSSPALAEKAPDYIDAYVPNAGEVGEGRLSYLIWDVYDARLFAPKASWKTAGPYALSLTYLMTLEGTAIADRSIEEMRKQGFRDEVALASWHTQMRRIFPDVEKGTTLTGIHTAQGESFFFKNGTFIASIKDPEFGKHFFGIWLSERTSEPQLRQSLLGL